MSILETLQFDKIAAGPAQIVDEMTVVPLVGNDRGNIAEPFSLKFERTTDYGHMAYKNDGESPAIIPLNIMIRGKDGQDHAMAGSGLIGSKTKRTFNNACCIESTQGGYLTDENNETDILPVALRKSILPLSKRRKDDYEKLWPDIQKWLRGTGVSSSSSHLRYFYDDKNIKKSLETFSSEFEPVSNQLGAIVLFQENIVGIEIMPTNVHWDAYWKLLLRGCYGAELLRLKALKLIKPSSLRMPYFPKIFADPDQLIPIIQQFKSNILDGILHKLDSIDVSKDLNHVDTVSDCSVLSVKTNTGGGGDLITQSDKPIYLSVVV